MLTAPAHDVLQNLTFADLPPTVVEQARRCLLDLFGTAAAGTHTAMSRIARDHAHDHLAATGAGAPMLFDGRRVSPPGVAFAGAATIDSFDAHDGHALTKGHAGAAVLPAALAVIDDPATTDAGHFLTAIVLGYEIAIRAALSLHASTPEYHSSGSWNALGAAATAASLLGLDPPRFGHALGLAEYHAPRGPMMRCIDHPSMVKDGSAAGSQAGVSATLLAQAGYTGAPADLLARDSTTQRDIWDDLGHTWRILECNFKPYPVVRWVHAALEAAHNLQLTHPFDPQTVARIDVSTFAQASRLTVAHPATAEEAQYSLTYPLACMIANGHIAPTDVTDPTTVNNPALVAQLADRTRIQPNEEFTRQFPAQRIADVRLTLTDGAQLHSGPTTAAGDPDRPLSNEQLSTKFGVNAATLLTKPDSAHLAALTWNLSPATSLEPLFQLLTTPHV